MGKGSKKIYWTGAGAAFLLAVLLTLAVILPRIVDSVWLKETIQTEVANQVKGEFDFQMAELSILPSPSITLQQVSLNIPETAQLNLDTIKVYPKLFPLLSGKIELDKIIIDRPDFSLPLPEKLEKKPAREKSFSLSEILGTASSKLSPILSAIPGLELGVRKGTMRLFAGDKQVFLFENISGSFDVNSKSLSTAINCESNIWESMELKASFAPGSMKGKGKIFLGNLNSKVLFGNFMTDKHPLLEGSISNLQVNFSVNPDDGLTADIQSSGASFAVLHEDKDIAAKIENLKGSIQHTDQITAIKIADFTLSNPQIELSGSFNIDRTKPYASLDLTTKNANISSLYEVLPVFINTLYGELPVVQGIFDITRGGTVTQASLQVEGKSLADLTVFESMTIQGHIENADISFSNLGLNLHGVTGEAIIANGVLEGKNLLAKLGNTTGSGGTLKLGLVKKETTPFHLDLNLNADLSEVPPLLKQLVPKKQLIEYLSLFESIEGTGQGRLTLGESLESLSARVEMNTISVRGNYKPIPYLISVDGGRILSDGLKTELFNLQGKIGRSTFSNYSSRVNFEGEPTLEVESGTLHIVLDEIFPWLAAEKGLEDDLKDIKKLTGIADVTVKSIKGPLLHPANLQYELQSELKNVVLAATHLPGPLNIETGKANILPDRIIFENLQADLLDSSLTYSGVLQNYISGKTSATVIVTGATIGPRVNSWFAQEIKAPDEYLFKTPLLISRTNLQWTRDELIDLQGDFSIKNGPIFFVDIMQNPDELILRNLSLKNGAEQTHLKMNLKKREIGVEFQGSLSKNTIDKILLHNDAFPGAWIRGDIRLHIYLDSLAESIATGNLDGGGFIFPWKLDKPVLFENFSLSATDKTITLNSAEAVFKNNKYSAKGQAALRQGRLTTDFDVRTDTVELDNILASMQAGNKEKTTERSWDLPVDGSIKLHADSLLYSGYTWKAFESLITYENNSLGIEILKGELCNINTPGKISYLDGQIAIDFDMEAAGQEVSEVLFCLIEEKQRMTGAMNLKANFAGQGTKDTLVNSLQGDLQFRAENGFIYEDAQAAKLLNFLSVTSMFKGKIPDLQTTGFHYDSLNVKGVMENGILTISPAMLEAPVMEIVSYGTIDIPRKKVDLQVLVAPLQTVNKIQKMLPIIRNIAPSNLAAIPVKVSGDFSDIQVQKLSMSSISTRVFGAMVDAMSTPIRALEGTPEK